MDRGCYSWLREVWHDPGVTAAAWLGDTGLGDKAEHSELRSTDQASSVLAGLSIAHVSVITQNHAAQSVQRL